MGLITKELDNDPRQESLIGQILDDQHKKWNECIN